MQPIICSVSGVNSPGNGVPLYIGMQFEKHYGGTEKHCSIDKCNKTDNCEPRFEATNCLFES